MLRALGLADSRIYTAIRIGIGRYNIEGEIDETARRLAQAVAQARGRTVPSRA